MSTSPKKTKTALKRKKFAAIRPKDGFLTVIIRQSDYLRLKISINNIIFSIFANETEMSTKEKLIDRLMSLPVDFTFDEVVRLFSLCGFEMSNKGHSSGSRVAFVRGD